MRRIAKLGLVGGTLAVVGAGALARSRLLAVPRPSSGLFPNGMPYARWGTGSKTLLFMPGGPGMAGPSGIRLAMLPLMFRPFADAGYTVWIVGRRRNLPKGHSMADMADDYAALIADAFGGRVDLVVGESYGGMIGFQLAARHPERFDHIAISVAGYKVNEQAQHMDVEFARLLSQGRRREAGALLIRELYPDIRVPGAYVVLGAAMARLFIGEAHPTFAGDVLVEAEAEATFDAREVLPTIPVPVLLVGGDRDQYFPIEVYQETARLIPDCTLRIYEGKDHLGANTDGRLYRDVLDFVREHPRARPEREAAQPITSAELAGTTEPPAAPEPELVTAGTG